MTTMTSDKVNVRLHYVVSMMLGRGEGNLEMVVPCPSPVTLPCLLAKLADELGEPFVKKVYNPETAYFNPGLSIMANGKLVDLRKLEEISLTGDAEVFIFPLYKGG